MVMRCNRPETSKRIRSTGTDRRGIFSIGAHLVLSLLGFLLATQSVGPQAQARAQEAGGICDRTQQVQDAILAALDGEDCAAVTSKQLNSITGTLDLSNIDGDKDDITSLRTGDFDGLSSVQQLWLYDNDISYLPNELLADMSSLTVLYLDNNSLRELPSDLFKGLSSLSEVWMRRNQLTTLPDGFFSHLSHSVAEIQFYNNPGKRELEPHDPPFNRKHPLPMEVSIRPSEGGKFRVHIRTGTSFKAVASLSATNGTLSSEQVTLSIGDIESEVITVTRTPGTTSAVTVSITDIRSTDPDRRYPDRDILNPLYHAGFTFDRPTEPTTVLPATDPPSTPSNVRASTPGSDRVTLSWDHPPDDQVVTHYGLYGRYWDEHLSTRFLPLQKLSIEDIPSDGARFSLLVTGLLASTSYVFKLQTVGLYEEKPWASALSPAVNLTTSDGNSVPSFGSSSYSFSIAEDAAVGAAVGAVSATDADSDSITYSITAGNGDAKFAIDGSSGAITTAGALDDESESSYSLTVQADDGNGGTASATVNVSVTEVVEDPDSTRDGAVSLGEQSPSRGRQYFRNKSLDRANGDVVDYYSFTTDGRYQLGLGVRDQSIDLDSWLEDAEGNTLVQSGPPANPNQDQTIEWLKTTIDAGTYYIKVQAMEDGSTSYYLRFGLSAPPNAVPSFGDESYSFSIAEDAATGAAVGSVSATDADSDTIAYSITAGNEDGKFAIDGSSGAITTAGTLDYESDTSYALSVQADDGNGGTSTATVSVSVTDVAEDPDGTRDGAVSLGDSLSPSDGRQFFYGKSLDGANGDTVDYYRFTTDGRYALGLGTRDQTIELAVTLEDAEGNTVGTAGPPLDPNKDQKYIEWLSITIDAGTYYIRVEGLETDATDYYIRFGLSTP